MWTVGMKNQSGYEMAREVTKKMGNQDHGRHSSVNEESSKNSDMERGEG